MSAKLAKGLSKAEKKAAASAARARVERDAIEQLKAQGADATELAAAIEHAESADGGKATAEELPPLTAELAAIVEQLRAALAPLPANMAKSFKAAVRQSIGAAAAKTPGEGRDLAFGAYGKTAVALWGGGQGLDDEQLHAIFAGLIDDGQLRSMPSFSMISTYRRGGIASAANGGKATWAGGHNAQPAIAPEHAAAMLALASAAPRRKARAAAAAADAALGA